MMKYKEFIDLMEEIAPTKPYKEIDNSGPQVCSGSGEVRKVLVCLEINMDVLKEAEEKGADMILTHHPLIFTPVQCIDHDDLPGRYIHEAVKKGISVYSSHLSFDFAPKGNNTFLAFLLGLTYVEEGSLECGYKGFFETPLTLNEAVDRVEKALDLPAHYVRCVDGGKEQLRTVFFCTGAGGDYIPHAAKNGCDLFITGDLKLHQAQYAKACGVSVIDAGHYGTEKIFVENMAHQLYAKAADKGLDIDVIMAEADTNPYTL